MTGVVLHSRTHADAASADGGADPTPTVLLSSTDGGNHWTRRPVPTTSADAWPFIAAVHPTRPGTISVRVQGPPKAEGFVESWLLLTEDGGDSWTERFRGPGDLLGFALADDGDTVLLGLGQPGASRSRGSTPARLVV